MKFSVERAFILRSLSHVQSVVEKRTTIPVLSNVKIEADADGLKLTATDMEIAITERLAAKVEEAGAITLPAGVLYDIIRKLPEGAEVEVSSLGNDQVQVKSGRSKFKLLSLPVESFPVMESGDLPHKFTLGSKDFHALLDKVRFAISNEETRYYLNGIYVHVTEEEGQSVIRSAATDGHRLARVSLGAPAGSSGMPGVIIPKKTVGELKKLLAEYTGDVTISLSETKILFELGDVTIVSKLIDGKFPDYDRVIPKNNDKLLEVNTKEFMNAVDRVSTVSLEKARAIKIFISTGSVTVAADAPDGSTATEEIEASYSADPIETGYNFRYVLDMMNQIVGETTQFVLSDSASPALVRDTSDVNVLYVIMPMRV
jgi:DNA polymerase-3 subunit beta